MLTYSGTIPKIAEYSQETIEEFEDILNNDEASDTIGRLMVWHQDPVVKARRELVYLKKEILSLGYYNVEDMPRDLQRKVMIMYKNNMNIPDPSDDQEDDINLIISQKKSQSSKGGNELREENQAGGLAGNALFDKSK